MIACPAIAMASRAKASRLHRDRTIWWAAMSASPKRAATAVAIIRIARSESVLTSSGTPA
ncbi:hypothetical protein STENM223S_09609 [Streptomyces tendae]